MIDNSKILVTGATGFLGSYLIRFLLQKGYKVRGLKRSGSSLELLPGVYEQVEWCNADILDVVALQEAFIGVTHVFHCAAIVSFHPKDKHQMHKTNVDGTANVVNLCLYNKVRQLIHISSIAALGRIKDRLELDEKCQWVESKGNSAYAKTKNLAEMEIWRGVAEGLSAVIISPSVIVGSQSWDKGMAAFFKKIDGGLKVCPTGQSGFVDVRDVVIFMEMMLQLNISGERFILNAVNLPHRTFFGSIAEALSVPPPRIMVGPLLAEIAWRVEWLKEKIFRTTPMATKESARASVTRFVYRNEKSLSVPGFTYRPFQQTITEIANQYMAAKNEGLKPKVLDF